MFKLILLLIFASLGFSTILDEAKEVLEELKSLVVAQITVSHDRLETVRTNAIIRGNNAITVGHTSLSQNTANYEKEIYLAKLEASNNNVDISSCLIAEESLSVLLTQKSDDITACISHENNRTETVVDDAKYHVDVQYNKVAQLEFQLNVCGESILCLSPLLTVIEEDMIKIPQNIKAQVRKAEDITDLMKIKYINCRNTNIAEYVEEASIITNKLWACVNNLLG